MLVQLALALVPSVAPEPVRSPDASKAREKLYERVLARALDDAQADLVAGIQLWKDHSRWEDPWVVESEHYAVRTTASYAVAAKIADDLEHMLGEFQRLLGSSFAPNERFQVWIFPTVEDYNTFGNSSGAADHSSMYAAYHASQVPESPVATCYTPNLVQLEMWVTHGAVHQFVETAFGGAPPTWISEGLASYFSLYWEWSYGARELARLRAGGFVPLERLTRAALPEYGTGATAHNRLIELGMLFHYLLNLREDTRIGAGGDPASGPFLEYVRAVLRGENISQLDVAPLLAEDVDLLEQDFKAFDFAK